MNRRRSIKLQGEKFKICELFKIIDAILAAFITHILMREPSFIGNFFCQNPMYLPTTPDRNVQGPRNMKERLQSGTLSWFSIPALMSSRVLSCLLLCRSLVEPFFWGSASKFTFSSSLCPFVLYLLDSFSWKKTSLPIFRHFTVNPLLYYSLSSSIWLFDHFCQFTNLES